MVKRHKMVSVCVILVAMTVGVILLPRVVRKQNEKQLLEDTIYWQYHVKSGTKVTSQMVAQLYYAGEINIGSSSPVLAMRENQDVETIRENTMELLETIFGPYETICNDMKTLLSVNSFHCARSSALTMVKNYPVVLSFVSVEVGVKDIDGVLNLFYEEKTNTLIGGSYSFSSESVEDEKEETSVLNMFPLAVQEYYEKELNLGADYYFYAVNNFKKDESGDIGGYFVDFGIMESEMKRDEMEKY